MELKCKRCENTWNYKGKKTTTPKYKTYVSCPKCRTMVELPHTQTQGEKLKWKT